MKISVIICTYNPRKDYLDRVINSLKAQSLEHTQWEIIIIDNNSNEPIEGFIDRSWHSNITVKVEAEQGLTAARLRGIQIAKGELLVFVDDDNILLPNYLETCSKIEREYPFLGAWGGSTPAEFETAPTNWIKDFVHILGVRTIKTIAWSNSFDERNNIPIGAGLAVRREVAIAYREAVQNDDRRKQLDRNGASLSGCGDTDLALTACDTGLGIGVFPELSLTHLIPKERVKADYLLKLMKGSHESEAILQFIRFGKVPSTTKTISTRKQMLRWWLNRKRPNHLKEIERIRKEATESARITINSLVRDTQN